MDGTGSYAGNLQNGWRVILELWLVASIVIYAAALTLRDGLDRTLDLADLVMPLLTAAVALWGVQVTVVYSLRVHNRTTWAERTRWAFDVIMNPHADKENLTTAISSLIRQLNVGEVPEEEAATVRSMIDNGQRRLTQIESARSTGWYRQSTQGGGQSEVE